MRPSEQARLQQPSLRELPPRAFGGLTCVDADAQAQLLLGSVADVEGAHSVQQRQSHAGHLSCVEPPVPHWEPRHHHVGVADRLHL